MEELPTLQQPARGGDEREGLGMKEVGRGEVRVVWKGYSLPPLMGLAVPLRTEPEGMATELPHRFHALPIQPWPALIFWAFVECSA